MAEEVFTKLALAEAQLETAIGLFVSGRDPVSAITLAGAADGILHGLVLKAGKSPFADYAAAVHEVKSKQTPSKAKYGKHINTTLMINALKHMDETDADDVALDVRFCALGAILKAISNLDLVIPERPPYAKA